MRFIIVVASILLLSVNAFAGQITDMARVALTEVAIQCYPGSDSRPNTNDRRIRCEEAKERWRLLPAADRPAEAEQWIADLNEAQEATFLAFAAAAKGGEKKIDWSGAQRWKDVIGAISEALRR
jgi:hypothetical protein